MTTDSSGSDSSNSEGSTDTGKDIALSGVSEEEIKFLKELVGKSKKDSQQQELEKLKAENAQLKDSAGSNNAGLATEIEELRKENELLKKSRRDDLLNQLEEKDREKYKDKTMQEIELILEYVRDHPVKKPRGVSREPSSDIEEKESKGTLKAGDFGQFNPKTRRWE